MSFFKLRKNKRNLNPETQWSISIKEDIISLKDSNQNITCCPILEIYKIIIETNDQGPFIPDVWWKLISKTNQLIFPQGCLGEEELLINIQNLPHFDLKKYYQAMRCTSNNEFICWTKR